MKRQPFMERRGRFSIYQTQRIGAAGLLVCVALMWNIPVLWASSQDVTAPGTAVKVVQDYLNAAAAMDKSTTQPFLSASCTVDILDEYKAYSQSGWNFWQADLSHADEKIDATEGRASVVASIVYKGGNPPSYLRVDHAILLALEGGVWKIAGITPPPATAGPGVAPLDEAKILKEQRLESAESAARSGDIAQLKILLQSDPELVFARLDINETLLHMAARAGHADVVELLLTNKADANAKDFNGATPLDEAATHGPKDVAQLLLAQGADVNAADNAGWTALHRAAEEGQRDIAELLVAAGADVNSAPQHGPTPLHLAAYSGQRDMAEWLLAHGANVNSRTASGLTPLHEAVYMDRGDVVELLLENKADVNAKDRDGLTPLDCAAIGISPRSPRHGGPPAQGKPAFAELLLAHGADINARDNNGWTPLRYAATGPPPGKTLMGLTPPHRSNPEVVKRLLDHGADVNSADNSGCTPLCAAKAEHLKEAAKLLRQHGGHE